MSGRRRRRRISDGGLAFITMMVTILLCSLWAAASAAAADAWANEPSDEYVGQEGNRALPGILAGAHEDEKSGRAERR